MFLLRNLHVTSSPNEWIAGMKIFAFTFLVSDSRIVAVKQSVAGFVSNKAISVSSILEKRGLSVSHSEIRLAVYESLEKLFESLLFGLDHYHSAKPPDAMADTRAQNMIGTHLSNYRIILVSLPDLFHALSSELPYLPMSIHEKLEERSAKMMELFVTLTIHCVRNRKFR